MKHIFFLLLPLLVCSGLYAFFEYDLYTKNQQTTINEFFVLKDGPYIAESNSVLDIAWICNDKAKHQATEFKSIPIYFSQCGLTAEVNTLEFTEDIIEFTGVSKIAALSDLHGQFDLMMQLLTNNKIINNEGKWSYGDGHFVITGDIFDRGDKVTEILWFIFELEQQAKQAGGSLHLLLGNHEVMVLNNDLRYLHAKYVRTAKLLDVEFVSLFNKHTILGRWLRSKAVLVKIDDYLFAHGGFHPDFAKSAVSLQSINTVFKQNLVKVELGNPREGFAKELHKKNGPIWYRGYFKDDGATDIEIDLLLQHFEIKNIVVGHTSQKRIESRYQGKVIAIDSSIKNGEYGEILFIENGLFSRGTLSGKRLALN